MKKITLILITISLLVISSSKLAAQSSDWVDYLVQMKHAVLKQTEGRVYESPLFTQHTPADRVELDLTGYKQLSLTAFCTEDGSDHDHAMWADAYFTKADGSIVWLSDAEFLRKKIFSGWGSVDRNLSGGVIKIAGEEFKKGMLVHAKSELLIDVEKQGFVKFNAVTGLEYSADRGSVILRTSPTTCDEEFAQFLEKYPEREGEFISLLGEDSFAAWLTTKGEAVEIRTLKHLISLFDKREALESQFAELSKISDEAKRLEAYINFYHKMYKLKGMLRELDQLDVDDVHLAIEDMNSVEASALYKEMMSLYGGGFDGLYALDADDLDRAEKFLDLKRRALLSNPLLDKIIVTRYKLGNSARSAMATQLGEPTWNYSSQLSTPKSGYDADIIELSNMAGGNPDIRDIYKPEGGKIVSNVVLHWDADRILFTSANEYDQLQTYEVGVDGSGAKQLIKAPEEDDDLEFFDATYLPDGRVVAASNVGYQGVPCISGFDHVGNFMLCDPKTGDMRRLQFDQESSWNPTVLKNGKVMFTHWEYTDLMHYYSRMVFTMNPDGTEQRALYGSGSMFPNSIFDMQELPDSPNKFIGIIAGHHDAARSGRLVIFDPAKSRKEEKGMVQEIPYKDRPIEPVVMDYLVTGVWPQFNKPYPLNDKYFLVSAKMSADGLWGIYLVDIYDNMTLIIESDGVGYIRPVDLKQRPKPAAIPDRVDLSKKDATVFIQDIYNGEGLIGVPRGTVKQLRVFAYDYVYLNTLSDHAYQGIQAGWDIKRLLGYVPVEEDGSVIFTVPANTPFAMQPVDSVGRAVQWMRSWTVGMPSETISCVGCHEDRSKLPIPKRTIASMRKPHKIEPVDGGVRLINFEHDIQPILDRACIACHNGDSYAGGRNFTKGRADSVGYSGGYYRYSQSYLDFHPYFYRQGPEAEMAVLNPYEYSAYNSDMIKMLRAGHHNVKLTDDEWKKIYRWLDFNMPYHNDMAHDPYITPTGREVDQYVRRRELYDKYGNGMSVDWKSEVEEYAKHLESQGAITPEMPEPSTEQFKSYKVKGFPFSQKVAAKMQGEESTKRVTLADGIEMVFRRVPAGEYVMGNNKPMSARERVVKIDKPFWMGEIEVSNRQMRALIPEHDSRYIGQFWKDHTTPGYNVDGDELSATKISLELAQEFCKRLSEATGLDAKLPTEEQWEWAARAGAGGDFWYGGLEDDFSGYENLADFQLTKMAVTGVDPQPIDSDHRWYRFLNYIPKIESVDDGNMLMTSGATYGANVWGLYDMQGNVSEWTSSTSDDYPQEYIVCGGSWYDRPSQATLSIRNSFLPWIKVWNCGFRVIIEE